MPRQWPSTRESSVKVSLLYKDAYISEKPRMTLKSVKMQDGDVVSVAFALSGGGAKRKKEVFNKSFNAKELKQIITNGLVQLENLQTLNPKP